jgi:hypothetical protein
VKGNDALRVAARALGLTSEMADAIDRIVTEASDKFADWPKPDDYARDEALAERAAACIRRAFTRKARL